MTRTVLQAAAAHMTEADLQRAVTDLAAIFGWQWVHFRPAQTSKGWRTPVSGPLGKGWPDLLLVRERDGRLLFVELKAQTGELSADQVQVQRALLDAGLSVSVWRPSDLDSGRIAEVLR